MGSGDRGREKATLIWMAGMTRDGRIKKIEAGRDRERSSFQLDGSLAKDL